MMDIKEDMDILDVGCANGETLKYIKDNYNLPGVKLYGIEPDRKLARQSLRYGDIYQGYVEDYLKSLPHKSFRFDAIIMGDVIEHLKEPWIILRDMAKRLKNKGAIYASIPNIMHASVLYNLFAGNSFSYGSCDIINKEHLRFFTIHDIINLFLMAGLNKLTTAGLTCIFPEETIEAMKPLEQLFGRNDYYFNVYQFIIKASKDSKE